MNSTLIYRCLRWLLPLFVARALVPAGFMLSVDAQGLALTFCPSVVAGPAEHHAQTDTATDAGASHHDHEPDHEQHRGHEGGKLCPFALAAGGCSVDIPQLAASVARPSFVPVPFESASPSSSLQGSLHIRGPPVVS